MTFTKFRLSIIFMLSIFYINLSANIDGIKVEIIKASMYGKVHIPLMSKRINTNNDMFRLGYMKAGQSTKKLIEDNEFYVITVEDKHSKGKLHTIIKGQYFKENPHGIGILTEVTFLLSQDLLGNNYDKYALEERLDTIAKKIINEKSFILNNNMEIAYSDVLLYQNGSKILYKPYLEYVIPLEKEFKNGKFTYDDAYNFVYGKTNKQSVQIIDSVDNNETLKIAPLYRLVLFFHIPQNTKIGTELKTLKQLRVGTSPVDNFEILQSSIPFKIKKDGTLIVSSMLDINQDNYSFEAIAHTEDGDSNKISFTIVIDKLKDSEFYKLSK